MKLKCILILGGLTLAALGGCSANDTDAGPAATSGSTAGEVDEAAQAAGAAATAPDGTPPTGNGVDAASRAFVDPVTGEMRAPTAAELAAMRAAESTDPAVKQQTPPPRETRLPDGTIMYDMRDQPQVEEKACVQADGSIGACPAR